MGIPLAGDSAFFAFVLHSGPVKVWGTLWLIGPTPHTAAERCRCCRLWGVIHPAVPYMRGAGHGHAACLQHTSLSRHTAMLPICAGDRLACNSALHKLAQPRTSSVPAPNFTPPAAHHLAASSYSFRRQQTWSRHTLRGAGDVSEVQPRTFACQHQAWP